MDGARSRNLQKYKDVLERAGVVFAPGLSTEEADRCEAEHGFRFPPDYREFLMFGLPISNGFVDWRNGDRADIDSKLAWPYEGMCFDIEHNVFWIDAWGPRPSDLVEAFAIAKRAVDSAPRLIPINGHRYIPDAPFERDNPVFSVHQMDIIHYGRDLFEYLENEFGYYFFGQDQYRITEPVKKIAFWSGLVG